MLNKVGHFQQAECLLQMCNVFNKTERFVLKVKPEHLVGVDCFCWHLIKANKPSAKQLPISLKYC